MGAVRRIEPRSLGKHRGHACEGHARGLCRQLFPGRQVLRAYPFPSPVFPDVVVLDEQGLLELVVIVAYWRNARNSDAKLHRTRPEYMFALDTRVRRPELFAPGFRVLTLLYGEAGGWKPQVLADLRQECPPVLFLPDHLPEITLRAVLEDVFGLYRDRWESTGRAAREEVEEAFAAMTPLPPGHRDVLDLLARTLRDSPPPTRVPLPPARAASRVPAPFRTRYRQGLALLSLFPDAEIRAWRTSSRAGSLPLAPELEMFARRALFLDLVTLTLTRRVSILGGEPVPRYQLLPRRPARGRVAQEYDPARPDFANWEEIPPDVLEGALAEHRARAASGSRVFAGAARDQGVGNWRDILREWLTPADNLQARVRAHDRDGLAALLLAARPVTAEGWHPASGRGWIYPLWDLVAALCALLRQDRAEWSRRGLRRHHPPTAEESARLAAEVLTLNGGAVRALLEEGTAFGRVLVAGSLEEVARQPRGALLSLDEPCSWLAAYYNNLSSSPTHNPLAPLARRWLWRRFPGTSWHGWPHRRDAPLAALLPGVGGRRRWQFLGRAPDGGVVAAEVKSITANNLGNKTKELYDRCRQTREEGARMGVAVRCVGILDGDFDAAALEEMGSEVGYDEIWSIREIMSPLRRDD